MNVDRVIVKPDAKRMDSAPPYVTLANCQFLANDANNGGGLYANNSTTSVTNCLFDQNDAAAEGGAMRVYNGSVTVADSTFADNASVTYGGALSIRFAPSFTITRSTFISNFSGEFGTVKLERDDHEHRFPGQQRSRGRRPV